MKPQLKLNWMHSILKFDFWWLKLSQFHDKQLIKVRHLHSLQSILHFYFEFILYLIATINKHNIFFHTF